MTGSARTTAVLAALSLVFIGLAIAFFLRPQRSPGLLYPIPLVASNFLDTATVRRSYADLVRAKEDLSDFDCYACHERGKAPTLRYDRDQNLIIPKEHSDIVMGHGSHGRNNNCFNCHNETNLELLQTRDGREVKFADSPLLCGSCHGPTYRDWEAGAHGRISGFWNITLGSAQRKACVNCHNPHSPRFPSRAPAPGPHPLRAAWKISNFKFQIGKVLLLPSPGASRFSKNEPSPQPSPIGWEREAILTRAFIRGSGFNQCLGWFSLSRRTGEGWGEGFSAPC